MMLKVKVQQEPKNRGGGVPPPKMIEKVMIQLVVRVILYEKFKSPRVAGVRQPPYDV